MITTYKELNAKSITKLFLLNSLSEIIFLRNITEVFCIIAYSTVLAESYLYYVRESLTLTYVQKYQKVYFNLLFKKAQISIKMHF